MFDLFVLIYICFNIHLKPQENVIHANKHNMRLQRQNTSSYLLRAYYCSLKKSHNIRGGLFYMFLFIYIFICIFSIFLNINYDVFAIM